MNDLITTTPADQFRAKASELFVEAASVSLHDLVDHFQHLTTIMDENMTAKEDGNYPELNDAGQLAFRERKVVEAAAKARFGIGFESYDRPSSQGNVW